MWGMNDQIMNVADRLARIGYVALTPDLYGGKLGADPGLAQEMMRALDDDKALAIVRESISYLRTFDGVSARPVATIGFGMGGRLSLEAALKGADVQATVIIYGNVVTTREAVAPIKAPLMGIFAGRDAGIPAADVKKFETALKESGKDAKIMQNDGVGHGFMNEDRADFEAEYSKDAWIVMRKWLASKLKPGAPETPETDGTAPESNRR
jgi:carboxymethylenebutenolidase